MSQIYHIVKICDAFAGNSEEFRKFLEKQNITGAFEACMKRNWRIGNKCQKHYIAKSKYYYVFGDLKQKSYLIKIAKFMDKIYELYRKKFKSDEKIAERFCDGLQRS